MVAIKAVQNYSFSSEYECDFQSFFNYYPQKPILIFNFAYKWLDLYFF